MTIEVIPLTGLPEISPGDDLGAILVDAARGVVRDGDVVVVTQKVVSKAEGRLVPAADGKNAIVASESRRVLARRGDLVIVETHHGFVCANAGVDASNVPAGFLSLLPEDPDASAARLRKALHPLADVGVVVSDTFGRAWRRGVVEVAIGASGLASMVDLRGFTDAEGRPLETTIVALADEIASAAGLTMGKADRVPAAIVRGIPPGAPEVAARALVRPPEEDLFPFSPLHAISARRTTRSFGEGTVPREALVEAVAAALTAPVPHGSRHHSRPWTWVILESLGGRRRLIDAMAAAWVRDLRADGTPQATIERRLAKSEAVLGPAPVIAVPFLTLANADPYADVRRAEAERDMFVLSTGAAVQNLMLALHAQGLASAWVSASLFCRPEASAATGLGAEWLAMGTVAIGPPPEGLPPARPPVDPSASIRFDPTVQ